MLNMGTRPLSSAPCSYLAAYVQTSGGAFTQDTAAIKCVNAVGFGAGAVIAADVNEDGIPEIIEADYINSSPNDYPVAFIVYGRDSVSNGKPRYSHRKTILRSGLFADPSYGATRIFAADINGDKHLDLIVTLENNNGGFYNTIDIWYGDGTGNFRPSGLNLSPAPNTVQMRELEIADVNHDGRLDFLLNSWNPGWWDSTTQMADLTNLIWLNTGTDFRHPQSFKVQIPTRQTPFVRWFSYAGKIKGFFVALGFDGILRICELELLQDFQ